MSFSLGIVSYNNNQQILPANFYFLALTNTYLASDAALSALPLSSQVYIDRWFQDLNGVSNGSYPTSNVWSKITNIYPYIGGTSTSLAINAKSPGTYNLIHTGSPTINANSISYNGTSQYSDTTFVPNGEFSIFNNSNFTGYSVHRVDTNVDSNATVGALGGGNSYAYFLGGVTGPGIIQMILSAKTANVSSKAYPTNSWYMASWASPTVINAYANGTNINTTTIAWDSTVTRSATIGAFNNASVGYGGPCTYDFYMGVTGAWSDTEALAVYNATKALKAGLGVTWN